jgi:hypothetical protein
MKRLSEVTVPRFSHDALSGEANEEAQRSLFEPMLVMESAENGLNAYDATGYAHFSWTALSSVAAGHDPSTGLLTTGWALSFGSPNDFEKPLDR